MQKGEQVPGSDKLRPEGTVRMVSNNPADPYDLMVPWSVRLTNSGEYAHSSSWNGGNIGIRSTSNGCTNLNMTDANGSTNSPSPATSSHTPTPAEPACPPGMGMATGTGLGDLASWRHRPIGQLRSSPDD